MAEQGIVRWYSVAKGYGFIRRDDGPPDEESDDIFVHYSEIPDDGLAEGDHVSFEVVEDAKGLKARKVTRADGPAG